MRRKFARAPQSTTGLLDREMIALAAAITTRKSRRERGCSRGPAQFRTFQTSVRGENSLGFCQPRRLAARDPKGDRFALGAKKSAPKGAWPRRRISEIAVWTPESDPFGANAKGPRPTAPTQSAQLKSSRGTNGFSGSTSLPLHAIPPGRRVKTLTVTRSLSDVHTAKAATPPP